MISDTLFDAARKIRRYQQEFPEAYAASAVEIGRVLMAMDALRIKLDKAPDDLAEEWATRISESESPSPGG
jgi:hypothetical protein